MVKCLFCHRSLLPSIASSALLWTLDNFCDSRGSKPKHISFTDDGNSSVLSYKCYLPTSRLFLVGITSSFLFLVLRFHTVKVKILNLIQFDPLREKYFSFYNVTIFDRISMDNSRFLAIKKNKNIFKNKGNIKTKIQLYYTIKQSYFNVIIYASNNFFMRIVITDEKFFSENWNIYFHFRAYECHSKHQYQQWVNIGITVNFNSSHKNCIFIKPVKIFSCLFFVLFIFCWT